MTAQSNFVSRLRAAVGALAGNAPEDLRNRVASLELDLRQKNDEIAALREEYERLREQGERERDSAASAAFDALARRLVPSCPTTRAAHAQANAVLVPDQETAS